MKKLGQLRKRLENANRAYTSLWGRLMRSPIQITSYFLGYHMFDEVYDAELERRGDDFVTLDFMDTILQTGPIPIDEFPAVFKDNFPIK